jgi:serine protease inhibitor
MRKSNAFSFVFDSFLLVGLTDGPGSASATPIYASLAASNTVFALNLYSQLAATNTGNIFFSPYSISACLGMVYAGARGETAQQMAQALDFSTNQPEVGAEFGALLTELNGQQGQGGVNVSIANGLWAQTNYPFLPAFLGNASNNFDASVQQVDFAADAPEITGQINQWVADKTADLITNLFAPGMLNSSTVLALVDAIYFKGGWESQFDTNNTTVQPFYISPSQTVNVPMMQQTFTKRPIGYYQDELLQAVALPYADSNLCMVILLPSGSTSLAELESALSRELPIVLTGMFEPYWELPDIWVALPRFYLAMSADLIQPLQNLGMIDAFVQGEADFSGMDGGAGRLFISVVNHKAVVKVDESGTVATAATGTGWETATPPPSFYADQPFIFLIYDTNSASILFMGRVVNPTTSGGAPNLPYPLIQTSDGNFGIKGNQFGFNVSGTNATVVVEACPNIVADAWFPVKTLTRSNNTAYFSEPMAPNASSRFYRLRSQ